MARVKANFIWGTLSADLPATGTSASMTSMSAGMLALPTIASPDIAVLVLDPNGIHGAPEVVYVTAHTTTTSTATITRAQEGSNQRAHLASDVEEWRLVSTAGDWTALEGLVTGKAPLASPAFTGTPTTAADPTTALGLATKGYVDTHASSVPFVDVTKSPYNAVAGGSAATNKTAFDAAWSAVLASGGPNAVLYVPGVFDVGAWAPVLPKYGAGPSIKVQGSMWLASTIHFSVHRSTAGFALGGLETDLYFHEFDHIGISGPGARPATMGDPLVNVIGGGTTTMAGIEVGSRMKLRYGATAGFDSSLKILGNHISIDEWQSPDSRDGVFFAETYANSGDVILSNCDLTGNVRSSIRVANYSIATFAMLKGHLGFCPYPVLFDSGVSGHLSMGGTQFIGTSFEATGNSFFYSADNSAWVDTAQFFQAGNFSRLFATYGIPTQTINPGIKVNIWSNVTFHGGFPLNSNDGPLFDVTGELRFTSDMWQASFNQSNSNGQPWILSSTPPRIRLSDSASDSAAFVASKAQTIAVGQLVEHNGGATNQVRAWGHYGGSARGILAGVALNASTANARECIVCVTRIDSMPVQVDSAAASSYQLVASSSTTGMTTGIVYDGTSTSTLGRPVIGEPVLGPIPTGGGTINAHITITA